MNVVLESRRLEVRCGLANKDQKRKVYVHMLNGTLCATERALCCIVENYQKEDVSTIRDFLFRKEVKGLMPPFRVVGFGDT